MKNLIVASTSTVYGSGFLEYLKDELRIHFKNTDTILFIPYARPSGISYEQYTKKAADAFKTIDKKIIGIHNFDDPVEAINNAKGIYVGGGNTFVLVNALYKNNLLTAIKNAVNTGTPYLGTSAGSNICGLTMHTTNDMPIVQPPSFKTFGFIPFNVNPHYLDPVPNSKHMGETRETRIKEFHQYNSQPVIGLREGSWLSVLDKTITLNGQLNARVFMQNKPPYEIKTNTEINF